MFSSQSVCREKKKVKKKVKQSTDRPSFSIPCLGKQNSFFVALFGNKYNVSESEYILLLYLVIYFVYYSPSWKINNTHKGFYEA